ncbi:hypothetical protein J7E88_23055 [Streptomyces sp. ISL-10]|uniref:hypothetical protein n=1 Tax=Streptomyces sp. ISL-10 TaxID=2819172 RepID=UPI001BEC937B|nr:hypothetical protein [Streptomyces sp. ISL-10]MBT2368117.1 hypothetical protein [Streptomyces sp. ISL-10]
MSDAGRVQQTGQAAKEQASTTAGQAGQAAGEVAGTAAEQARAVAGEARQQAGSAVRDLRQRVMEEGQGQAERLAGTVRQWADDLAGLARNAPGDSPARSLAAQASDQGHRAADYLDKNGVEGLVGDLQGFARRRPGAFLGGAVVAGLVVGRLAKAGKAQSSDGGRQAPARQESSPLPQSPVRPELPGYPGV